VVVVSLISILRQSFTPVTHPAASNIYLIFSQGDRKLHGLANWLARNGIVRSGWRTLDLINWAWTTS